MTGTEEAIKCRCGLRMIHTPRGAFICENCDQLQPQQVLGFRRNKTKHDIRFNMYWQEIMQNEYEDNTKGDKPVDTELPEAGEDPDEGDNDE